MPFSRPAFTGFPFDDSDFEDRDRNTSFRDTLDDIAKRHPEFAQHLNFDNKFPFRSNTWGHKRRGSGEEGKPRRFAEFADHLDRPSSSRFKEKFGFPFSGGVFDATACFPEPELSTTKEQKVEETAKPPQVPTKERGRKQNPNIPQSSTVDLGQKQEPVCESRVQRSMSAPPENRSGQRFVSSINIPMNADGANEPQGQSSQQQSKPNERVIPIHVEGRDEPVLPKHPNQTFSQQPQNERSYGQKPAGFGQWKRNESPYYAGESFTPEPHYEARHQFFTGHPQQKQQNTEHFPNTPTFNKQQQTPPPTQQKSATPPPQPPPQQQQPPPPPPQAKSGPISQIQCIQRDVLELMGQVEKFNGQPRDKQYMYLDEMLTRNLLKLDDIETEGKENIRHARKEAINCIQKCISILEAKALANEQLRNAMEVDTKVPEETPLSSLEVSGISRSGSENTSSQLETDAPMEATDTEVVDNTETEVEAPETTDVDIKDKENENVVNEELPAEESVESSQEAPKVTKDKKKVKKKENTPEKV
ncbi:hypothetical protein RN001_013835 [Aquatica leii]|uniref:BAG domain-containing protein n=1 Tax=Aquatica leii TaxID=1421715 RepID=A0AAN7Q072_9COLE|nr:hypothetical protein RN001_013835 [Aquatica leii]